MSEGKKRPSEPPRVNELRRAAEDRFRQQGAKSSEPMAESDVRALVHELQVHQIELEMQNEELRRAQAALQTSEERFRNVVETSPDAIALLDLDGRILMASRQSASFFGFDCVDDLLSSVTSGFELLAPEDRQRARDNVQRLVEAGVLRNLEYCGCRRDGSRFPLELSASLQRDLRGNPEAMILVLRDITERERAGEALRRSEEEHRKLVETCVAGIALHEIVLDDQGKPIDYVLLIANPAFERKPVSVCVTFSADAPPRLCQALKRRPYQLFWTGGVDGRVGQLYGVPASHWGVISK